MQTLALIVGGWAALIVITLAGWHRAVTRARTSGWRNPWEM